MTDRIHTIADQRIAVEHGNDRGRGPAVVFLHGFLSSVQVWRPVLPPAFRESVRWYSVGLPGHWPSRLGSGEVTPDSLVDVLDEAIRRSVGDEPVHLVGWSTGGFASLLLAARRPERVRSVLSLAGFASGRWHGLLGALQKLACGGAPGRTVFGLALRSALFTRWGWSRAVRRLMAGRVDPCPAAAECLRILHRDARRHRPSELARVAAAVRGMDITGELSRIEVPTRIVAGAEDPCIRVDHACAIAAAIPGADLDIWPQVGHVLFAERLDLFRRTLTD